MVKKIPVRRCVGCGERRPKKELIRVVYTKETGAVSVDKKGKAPGRGAYLCPEEDCLSKARKSNALSRTLKISISDSIYEPILEEINLMKD